LTQITRIRFYHEDIEGREERKRVFETLITLIALIKGIFASENSEKEVF
jgi:hypothetical protein